MSFSNFEIETGNEKYLKINPGDVVLFHILSKEPIKVANHWINKKKYECNGKSCAHCDEGDKPKKGWKIKVFERKDKVMKEYEFGPQVAAQIRNIAEILAENQQTVEDIDLRIKREGSGMETEYFVNQVPKKELVPEALLKQAEVPF